MKGGQFVRVSQGGFALIIITAATGYLSECLNCAALKALKPKKHTLKQMEL